MSNQPIPTLAAGLHPDMREADYFADPCPSPSLTQSIAKILLEKSPLHAWYAHPRLNPDYRHDDATKFDVGNIAHKLMLGRGRDIVVLDFDDWRTKAAQNSRAEAAAEGRLAVLGKHHALADRMVKAAREQLDLRGLGHLFSAGIKPQNGDSEVAAAWQEEPAGFWCRQLIDWLSNDRRIFCDYKTTDMSAAPHNLARMLVTAGWDIQGAMGERALMTLDPLGYRRRFFFVVQETCVPYALSVVELSETALTMGRKKLAAAMAVWRDCLRTDRWPAYPLHIVVPDYPEYAEAQWLERERTEFSELLMAG